MISRRLLLSRPFFSRVPARETIAGEKGQRYTYAAALAVTIAHLPSRSPAAGPHLHGRDSRRAGPGLVV